jgi:hypothetical protein
MISATSLHPKTVKQTRMVHHMMTGLAGFLKIFSKQGRVIPYAGKNYTVLYGTFFPVLTLKRSSRYQIKPNLTIGRTGNYGFHRGDTAVNFNILVLVQFPILFSENIINPKL